METFLNFYCDVKQIIRPIYSFQGLYKFQCYFDSEIYNLNLKNMDFKTAKQKISEEILVKLIVKKHFVNKCIQEDFYKILNMYYAINNSIENFIIALNEGNIYIISHLIDNMNYDVNYNRGDPLRIACKLNHFIVVKFLLSRNADITLRRFSAFKIVCSNGNFNIIKLFIPYLYQCFDCQNNSITHWNSCYHTEKKLKINLMSKAIADTTKKKYPDMYNYLQSLC